MKQSCYDCEICVYGADQLHDGRGPTGMIECPDGHERIPCQRCGHCLKRHRRRSK